MRLRLSALALLAKFGGVPLHHALNAAECPIKVLRPSSVVPAILRDSLPNRKHLRGAQLNLLRYRRAGGLKHRDHWSRQIYQGFNDDGHHPGTLHVEHVGSTR
jgi:hypothetical protein